MLPLFATANETSSRVPFSIARRELEVPNPRVPIDHISRLARQVIAIYIPERTVVGRIERYAGDISPKVGILLVAGAVLDDDFRGRRWVREAPVGRANNRMHRRA